MTGFVVQGHILHLHKIVIFLFIFIFDIILV